MKNYTHLVDIPYRNVISFVARGTNSGKTYLLERLITELKRRGRKVTAVKHAMHGHAVDPEGKDTFRFAQRGADRVILFSPEGLLMYEARHPETDYLYTIASQDMDIVLVEGFKDGPFKKVEVFNEEIYTTPLCVEQPGFEYIAIVSRGAMDVNIPRFCFEDIEAIALFIEESAGLNPNT
jgi:molybdopterin-guanine dinucleotide biosynthesis adapter protein